METLWFCVTLKKEKRRERPKSAPYLRLKNIEGTTIGNIWIFFSKNIFLKKSHNAEKLKKRPFRLIKRFYKPKTSKKCKGVPFDRIRKFSKKSRIVPKKPQRVRLYFWKHKKFVVQCENRTHDLLLLRKLVEQMSKRL